MARLPSVTCAERFLAASPLVAPSSGPSHIVVDLASTKVEAALSELTKITKIGKKVKKATVHANTLVEFPGRFGRVTFETKHVLCVFEALAKLPNLHSLIIELNFHVISLPVSAILAVFRKRQLKRLTLKHLHLLGSEQDFEELRHLAQLQTSLKGLSLDSCRGLGATRALVYHLPCVQELRIVSSALAPTGALREAEVANLVTPHLRSLKLDDIPDLHDKVCIALANTLANTFSQVQELHLASSMLSEEATRAITTALQSNTALRKLTLHVDSEDVGMFVADIIAANTSLESIDMRLHNDANFVGEICWHMAQALQMNTNLKCLRLRLEIELDTLPAFAVDAFANALKTNSSLQMLSLDDGIYRYPLPPDIKLQLALNECGGRQLLQHGCRTKLSKDGLLCGFYQP